ncbi:MAG: acyl carrier protein [Pyrinomonadaceae bacterium]
MTDETVKARVVRVFSEFKKIPVEQIKMDTTFEELGLDSLDGLNLIFELEEEFNLVVPDEKVQSMKTVGQVVEGMEQLLADKAKSDAPAESSMENPAPATSE